MDEFIFDDNEFQKDAGISELSEAYVKVFENIKNLAEEGISTAIAGIDKGVLSITSRMLTKITALNSISDEVLKKIVYDDTKELISASLDPDNELEEPDDESFVEKINKIINMTSEISYDDALNQIEENSKNIEDNGTDDFGDPCEW